MTRSPYKGIPSYWLNIDDNGGLHMGIEESPTMMDASSSIYGLVPYMELMPPAPYAGLY